MQVVVRPCLRNLRIDLRKAYNMVVLFGAEDARTAAQVVWRTARNAGNDFFSDLSAHGGTSGALSPLRDQIAAAAAQIGTSGEDFLGACRADLQVRDPTAQR